MEPRLQAADLGFFSALAMAGSLSAAAREMRITTAAVSKRLSQMETRLGLPLVNRTTRRMSLTVEGETVLRHARSILAEMADLEQQLGAGRLADAERQLQGLQQRIPGDTRLQGARRLLAAAYLAQGRRHLRGGKGALELVAGEKDAHPGWGFMQGKDGAGKGI